MDNKNTNNIVSLIVGIIVYAFVLMVCQNLFKNIYIENFYYAIIAAIILNILNASIKPLLTYLTLPLTIITFGLAYPIVNVIILKICDVLMGNSFNLGGLFSTFIISIFIGIFKAILDCLITKRV